MSQTPKAVPRIPAGAARTSPTSTSPRQSIDPETDEKADWMSRAMEEDTDALELRERTYPWTGMHTFGILSKPNSTTCRSHLNRHRELELIYQHMHSIGMHHAAFTLARESQLEFQRHDQNMDRTDLRLLVSLCFGPRENVWDTSGIDSTVFIEEPFDDDNGSVNHTEPVNGYKNPLEQVTFARGWREFAMITLAPLKSLVVLLVSGDDFGLIVREDDKQKFFITLNSICKSEHLYEHLFAMFNELEPDRKGRVLAFINDWVRFSGLFIGKRTLNEITLFLQTISGPVATELLKLIPNLDYGHPTETDEPPPNPVIVDVAKLLDPDLKLTTPEPVELARQITLATQQIFTVIHPREFYAAIANRRLSLKTPGLNELYEFGTRLKMLVASTVLLDKQDSVRTLTRIIDTMEQLLILRNYESLSWLISALEMKCVQNLEATYTALSDESKHKWQQVRMYGWRQKNEVYERALTGLVNHPTIPNMRYELSISAVGGWGGEEFIGGLVNWEKRQRAAVYLLRYYGFQNNRYKFHAISQIQSLFKSELPYTKDDLNTVSANREAHMLGGSV